MWCNRRHILLAPLALGACGFTPIYREGGAAAALQGQVDIAVISGRNGFEFRERLEDLLGFPVDSPRFRLTANISVTSEALTVSDTAEITRFTLEGNANFKLHDQKRGETVLEDTVRSFTAYGATSETFPTNVAKRDAEIRLAKALAERVADRLALAAPDLLK